MTSKLPVSLPLLVPLALGLLGLLALLLIGKVPIGYNLRNLVVRWPISLLTAVAFTLVVGLLTVLLAFVNGMYRITDNSGKPGNVIVLSDGATDELFSNLGYSDTNNLDDLLDADRRAMLERDGSGRPLVSRELYVVINQPMPATREGERPRRRFIQVRGIDDVHMAVYVHDLELVGGEWFSAAGVRPLPREAVEGVAPGEALQAGAAAGTGSAGLLQALPFLYLQPENVAPNGIEGVLGESIAGELGLKVGDIFDLGGRKWIVSGIMKSEGTTYGSEIWCSKQKAEDWGKRGAFTTLALRTNGAASADAVAKALRDKNVTRGAAFNAMTELDYYSKLAETNRQFLVAILFVAGVMAVGGVFGVMNTMFAAISQRTKDIGVLRILGFARWQILVSFFLETLLIALAGGALGLALGFLFADGRTATSVVSNGPGGAGKSLVLRMTVDANIVAGGLLFSLIMGALGGLLPSLSAMRLKPLESLR